MHRFHHRLEELARLRNSRRHRLSLSLYLHISSRYLKIQAVQSVPLLSRDLFSYMPRVLAGGNDARNDRRLIPGIEG
jgi:hypothetical protein